MTPAAYNPDRTANTLHTTTPGPLSDPERAEIQTRRPDPVAYSPTGHGAPHTEMTHTTAFLTPTSMLDDYEVQDFNTLESVPVREDILDLMHFPPLPTTRSQPARLDISLGGEEGGLGGSGQGGSGSGEGDEAGTLVTPTQVWAETTSRPSWLLETTTRSELGTETTTRSEMGMETTSAPLEGAFTPAPGEVGPQQPAVVFKEDVTPGATTTTFDLEQSLAIPVDGESSAKPPFHLIIVNVHDKNQSGKQENLIHTVLIKQMF